MPDQTWLPHTAAAIIRWPHADSRAKHRLDTQLAAPRDYHKADLKRLWLLMIRSSDMGERTLHVCRNDSNSTVPDSQRDASHRTGQ